MFLHHYQPLPVLISIGPFSVYWYGFFIALSVIFGFFIGSYLFKKYALTIDAYYDLVFYLVVFGVIGARLWHVFSEFSYYQKHLLDILKIWHGGLAIHGVILAGVLTLWAYSIIKKTNFWLVLDIFAPLLAFGQALGRWGNYFNQELYGRPTDLAWGIPIDLANRLTGFEQFNYFQPIFIYESLALLFLLVLLIRLHWIRIKHSSKHSLFNGGIFLVYLAGYSIIRFFIGFLRIDPQANWLSLRLDQWVSLLIIIVSLIGFFILRQRQPSR